MKCANDFLIMNVGMKTLRLDICTGGTGVIVLYSILDETIEFLYISRRPFV